MQKQRLLALLWWGMTIFLVARARRTPNVVFVLTDDQDLRLGSMVAMPFLRNEVLERDGTNFSNFFIISAYNEIKFITYFFTFI